MKKKPGTIRLRAYRHCRQMPAILATLTALATVGTATLTATAATAVTTATLAATTALRGSLGGCDAGVRGEVLLAVLLTVADPDLDTKAADLRVRDSECVVDVCTESMERGTSFLEHLAAGHFGAADAAADLDLDALGTHAHGGGDGHLDGAAIADAAFDLTGDAVSDDVGVNLGALDLEDVDLDILLGDLLELLLEHVDLLAALADDDTRTGRVDRNGNELQGALDDDACEAGLRKTVLEVFADAIVFFDLLRVVSTTPVGVPTTGDTDSVADRISFLSHSLFLHCFFDVKNDGDVVGTLADAAGAALRARTDSLQRTTFVDHEGLDVNVAVIELGRLLGVLGLPVGDSAADNLFEILRSSSLGVLQEIEGVVNFLTAHGVSDEAHLPGRGRDIVEFGNSGLLLGFFQALGHQSFSLSHNVNSL